MQRWIIFTDLDGTLLDRQTYSWAEARVAVETLKKLGIPIVFCSSKTHAEQIHCQQQMGIRHPMIVENGSAIILPHDYFASHLTSHARQEEDFLIVEIGCDAAKIRAVLDQIQQRFGLFFRGYAQMSDTEMTSLTGLSGHDLERARQREYSETIVADFGEADWSTFKLALADQGLACISGGHLFTVTSQQSGKARAAQTLIDLYRQSGWDFTAVGLGDSPNDRDMLEQMDIAYQVQRPDGTWHNMNLAGILQVGIGPHGWQQAITQLLSKETGSVT